MLRLPLTEKQFAFCCEVAGLLLIAWYDWILALGVFLIALGTYTEIMRQNRQDST